MNPRFVLIKFIFDFNQLICPILFIRTLQMHLAPVSLSYWLVSLISHLGFFGFVPLHEIALTHVRTIDFYRPFYIYFSTGKSYFPLNSKFISSNSFNKLK